MVSLLCACSVQLAACSCKSIIVVPPFSLHFRLHFQAWKCPFCAITAFYCVCSLFIHLVSFTKLPWPWLCPLLMGKSKEFIAMAIDKTPHGSSPLHFVLIVSEQQVGTECRESFLKRFYGVCVIPHWHTSFHTSTGCFGCQAHVLNGCST